MSLKDLNATYILVFASIILSYVMTNAQDGLRVGDWRVETSTLGVRAMESVGSDIFAGTTGGLLRYHNDGVTSVYTILDGLSSIDINCMASDIYGNLLLGMDSPIGVIDVFHTDTGSLYTINEGVTSITAITVVGDSVFAGFNASDRVGILLLVYDFDANKYFFRDSFSNFPLELTFTEVMSVEVIRNSIYVGTDFGMMSAGIRGVNLKDPTSWGIEDFGDLPPNNIRAIGTVGDTLLVAPQSGVYRRVSGQWEYDGAGARWTGSGRKIIVDEGYGILLASTSGVFRRKSGGGWEKMNNESRYTEDMVIDEGGKLWAGFGREGVAAIDESGSRLVTKAVNTPFNNAFNVLRHDNRGRLWVASKNGFGELNNKGWHSFIASNDGFESVKDSAEMNWAQFVSDTLAIPRATMEALLASSDGRVYFGYGGAGMLVFDPSNPTEWVHYDTTDGRLSGSEGHGGNSSFVIVKDIQEDSTGNIWIANAFSQIMGEEGERHLAMIDSEGNWHHWGVTRGLMNGILNEIDIDFKGRIWLSFISDANSLLGEGGVQILDYNGTVEDTSDDNWYKLTTAEGLESNQVRSIAIDKDNVAWIAAVGGVHRLLIPDDFTQSTLQQNLSDMIPVVSNHTINEISVDIRNNKWFATETGGVKVLLADNSWFNGNEGLTRENSPLLANNINSIAFDRITGDVFIATLKGLSILRTEFAEGIPDLDQVVMYPSPFIIPSEREMVIDNLSDGAVVKILDVNGDLVRELNNSLEIRGRQGFWDGRDEDGRYVSSGIYFSFVFTASELSKSGKIAVIRR